MISEEKRTIHILVTGASGFLGQHLLHYLMRWGPPLDNIHYKIIALYNSAENFAKSLSEKKKLHPNVEIIPKCSNLVEYTADDNKYDICIHSAALSSPRACENDPDKAMAVNVPISFLKAMKDTPLMIILSTDQVYDGKQKVESDDIHSFYQEDSALNPLNVYAKSKVQLEETLRELRPSNKVSTKILRSSIIIGPKAPISPDDAHDSFLHFCASRENTETSLWKNEYRTVVSMQHVCGNINFFLLKKVVDTIYENSFEIFNMGGPNRVNRYDMAQAVFEHFGYNTNCLVKAEQTASTVPLDISMDSTKLCKTTGIIHKPTTLKELVKYTFPTQE